jgi:hypothetical protein
MDELFAALDDSYSVVCVRNNNDFGKAGIGEPLSQPGHCVNPYVNAGLVAAKHHGFMSDWFFNTWSFSQILPFGSQTVLNGVLGGYLVKILDPIEAPVYYGVSALSGTETHWDSWKEITVVDGDLMLNNKKVKVLHHGGGFKAEKLGFEMFSEEVRKRLEEIIA